MKSVIFIALISFSAFADETKCNGTNGYSYYQSNYDSPAHPGYAVMTSTKTLSLNGRVISDVREYYAKRPSVFGKPAIFKLDTKKALPGSKRGEDVYSVKAEISLDIGQTALVTFSCRRTYSALK